MRHETRRGSKLGASMLALILSAASSIALAAEPIRGQTSVSFSAASAKETWSGTASCTVECTEKDGTKVCRVVTATCTAMASYESAKRDLEASIEAQIRATNGRIQGSISFSIRKELRSLAERGRPAGDQRPRRSTAHEPRVRLRRRSDRPPDHAPLLSDRAGEREAAGSGGEQLPQVTAEDRGRRSALGRTG